MDSDLQVRAAGSDEIPPLAFTCSLASAYDVDPLSLVLHPTVVVTNNVVAFRLAVIAVVVGTDFVLVPQVPASKVRYSQDASVYQVQLRYGTIWGDDACRDEVRAGVEAARSAQHVFELLEHQIAELLPHHNNLESIAMIYLNAGLASLMSPELAAAAQAAAR